MNQIYELFGYQHAMESPYCHVFSFIVASITFIQDFLEMFPAMPLKLQSRLFPNILSVWIHLNYFGIY